MSQSRLMRGVRQHIAQLEPLFLAWKVDDSLFASWRHAAVHMPAQRGACCKKAFVSIEQLFDVSLRDIEARWGQAKVSRDTAERELQSCEAAARAAQAQHQRLGEIYRSLQTAEKEAIAAVSAAKQVLEIFEAGIRRLEQDRDACFSTLRQIQEGPLAAYKWLLNHSIPGYANYTASVNCENPITICLRKCVAQSEACREMLTSAVLSSLGPAPQDRDDLQTQVASMIRDVLHMRHVTLAEAIRECLPSLGGAQVAMSELSLIHI